MVDLVFEEDASHLVADELGRLDLVVLLVQVIMLETARDDGQLEVAPENR